MSIFVIQTRYYQNISLTLIILESRQHQTNWWNSHKTRQSRMGFYTFQLGWAQYSWSGALCYYHLSLHGVPSVIIDSKTVLSRYINNHTNSTTMSMMSRQSHCKSLSGSFDECRTVLSSDQVNRLRPRVRQYRPTAIVCTLHPHRHLLLRISKADIHTDVLFGPGTRKPLISLW